MAKQRYIVKPVTVFHVIDTENTHDNDGFVVGHATKKLAEEACKVYEKAVTESEEPTEESFTVNP